MALRPMGLHVASRWTALAVIAVLILFFPVGTKASPPEDRFFRIEARSFAYRPAELAVHRGDRVTLELISTNVVHGLYLDGYDLKLSADPGQSQRVTFVADRAGTFRFRCSVTCGPLHPFMVGRLRVEPTTGLTRILALASLAALAGLAGVWMAWR